MTTYSEPTGQIETYQVELREKVELHEVNKTTVLLDEHGQPRKVQSVG